MRSVSSDRRLLSFLAAGLLGLGGGTARALEAAPEGFHFTAVSGERIQGDLLLSNEDAHAMNVEVSLVPVDGGVSPGWIRLSKSKFRMSAHERRKVRFSGKVPSSLGEWLGRFLVRGEDPKASWYEVRLLRPVQVRVPAAERCEARLEGAFRREGADVLVEGVLTNEGNVHLRPRFLLEVDGRAGDPLHPEPASTDIVMPGGTFPFRFRVEGFPEGKEPRGEISAFFPSPDGTIRVLRQRIGTEAKP